MSFLQGVHHIAIICSDYEKSKAFYTNILGFQIQNEVYRSERNSYKLDLSLNHNYCIELFSFPDPPKRSSRPEATGLRHLAFSVKDLDEILPKLRKNNVQVEEIRTDEFTKKRFTFIHDPDGLPIELCETKS